MINTRTKQKTLRKVSWLTALCLCLFAACAAADGLMPMMPAPPDTPVYWQLQSIVQDPAVTPSGGYAVEYEVLGLSLDLTDGLMAESLIESDPALSPSATLTISKDGRAMRHTYSWTALPVYLEPNTAYTIDLKGTETESGGGTLSSLLGLYTQGKMDARVSANGYTGHADKTSLVVNASETMLYNDGSLVISLVLRDVNDMFRLRIVYTYEMHGGVKPEPTPVPGFVAVDMPDGVLPSYYDAVEGHDALWAVTTAREEYRAYGSMSGSEPMFFPADAQGNVAMDETPADIKADFENFVEGFVPTELAEEAPSYYRAIGDAAYAFTSRDGETVTRVYGRVDGGEPAFYPVDEAGVVPEGAGPVDPAEDYTEYIEGFGAAEPPTLYDHYERAGENVYAFTGRDGETRYRVFGRLDGAEPAYYEATPDGEPTGGTPVLPNEDFEAYIKGFDATEPQNLPAFYEIVDGGVYAVKDRQGVPVYRAYGVKDGQAPAFYASDAEGTVADDAAPVSVEDDFAAYVAGFESVPMSEEEAPLYYDPTDAPNVWTFTDVSGNTHYRTYGILNRGEEAFYPSDERGNVAVDALPVQPASDLAIMPAPKFAEATPEEIPEIYSLVREGSSLYAFNDRDGEPVYRIYGAYGRAMPQFFPADVEGHPVENAVAVTPEEDFEAYFAGFEAQAPTEVPTYYTITDNNLYTFTTRENEVVYRVYGTKDRRVTGFFPSDAEGNLLSGEPIAMADEIPLMPTSAAYTVTTPEARNQPDSTPLARAYESPPGPTPYAANITATETQPGNTPLARAYESPPGPTPYLSSITATETPTDSQQEALERSMEPAPAATDYTAGIALPDTVDSSQGQSVERSVPGQADATSFSALILPTGEPTETENPVTRSLPAQTPQDQQVMSTSNSTPVSADPTDTATVAPRSDTAAPADDSKSPSPAQTGGNGAATTKAMPTEENKTSGPSITDAATQTEPATEETTEETTEATGPSDEPTEETATEGEPTSAEMTEALTEDKQGGLSGGWIALIVVGVAAIGGGGYAVLRKKK